MFNNKRVCSTVCIMAGLLFTTSFLSADGSDRPHIVVIVADDLGWHDVGYHGSNIRTPHLDRLAQQGTQLDRFYVCPICSPTRAGLMTGRYPIRFGAMRAVIPPWRKYGVPTDEVFLPQMLARAGYRHRACFGKWHLGHSSSKYHPLSRGFTHFEGHYNGAIDYFTHEREGEIDWHVNFQPSDKKGYTTHLLAESASNFIRTHADEGPLFCYVPFNAPHGPLQAPEEALQAYENLKWRGKPAPKRRKTYAAMVTLMDKAVGRILKAIDETGIRDNTLVWFFSDNGGTGRFGDNRPLRGKKQDVFEGGIRTPALLHWPGRIEGGRKISEPLAYIDVFPTLMHAAGLSNHRGNPLDGRNLLGLLRGEKQNIDRKLYHYWGQRGPHNERIALLNWPWKLVVLGPDISQPQTDKPQRRKILFRLDTDPGEQNDLADRHPDRVQKMFDQLSKFRELQPDDGVPPYAAGRSKDFQPPPHWQIPR